MCTADAFFSFLFFFLNRGDWEMYQYQQLTTLMEMIRSLKVFQSFVLMQVPLEILPGSSIIVVSPISSCNVS
jgi:hypothetical protein